MGVVAILIVIVGFSGPMPGDQARPRAFSPLVLLHGAVVLAPAMLVVGAFTAVAAARRGYPFDGDPLRMMVHPLGDLVSVAVLMNAPLTHLHARLPDPLNANPLVFLLPMVPQLSASAVYDRVSRGRVHPVSLWGTVLLFAWANARELLIGPSGAWHQARRGSSWARDTTVTRKWCPSGRKTGGWATSVNGEPSAVERAVGSPPRAETRSNGPLRALDGARQYGLLPHLSGRFGTLREYGMVPRAVSR